VYIWPWLGCIQPGAGVGWPGAAGCCGLACAPDIENGFKALTNCDTQPPDCPEGWPVPGLTAAPVCGSVGALVGVVASWAW
jgi:hypothetical protein